jgi:hypothetical protein
VARFPTCASGSSVLQRVYIGCGANSKPPVRFVPGVRWPGCEADHSLPYSAEVKIQWSYTFAPPICLYGVAMDNISIYIYIYISANSQYEIAMKLAKSRDNLDKL